jgi:pimeloyl-ACP methyl ester carboxylesterase
MASGHLSLAPLVLLSLVLLVFGGVTAALTALYMAESILRPPRMSDGKALYLLKRLAPDDLGLPYERVIFTVRDERTGRPLSLAAWWVPCEAEGMSPNEPKSDRCAVLVHGYADAKVGAIAWAPLWHELGYNLLVPDLRAHGESGGKFTTAGFFERHDLVQVINQTRAERPAETRQIVLFGASMGAVVAAATAVEMGPNEVSAVVLESPMADMRNAISAHIDRLGLPGGLIRSAALWLGQLMSGVRFADIRTVDLLARLSCPVMVISPPRDVYLLPGDAEAIRTAVAARTAAGGADCYWLTDNAEHLTAIVCDPAEYRRRVAVFLAKVIHEHTQPGTVANTEKANSG